MKTIVLVRHAKSSWDNPEFSDFERPLNGRGIKDAPFMGSLIKKMGLKPDLMVSSPAVRALTTCKMFAEAMEYPIENIVQDKKIYEYGPNAILAILESMDDKVNTVFLFGHNPDMTHLTNFLSGVHVDNVPTCGVSCIDIDSGKWENLRQVKGDLRFFEYPKKHKNN